MTSTQILLTLVTLTMYCVTNSILMTGFFIIAQPAIIFFGMFKHVLSKTLLSLGIVFAFFAFLARMFCLTAWIGQCLQCICIPIDTEAFAMQNTMSATIIFFFGVAAVQLGLIIIPKRLSRLSFVMIVIASNLIASLLKLGLVAMWGL